MTSSGVISTPTRLVLPLLLLIVAACGGEPSVEPVNAPPSRREAPENATLVQLYFPGANGLLNREERALPGETVEPGLSASSAGMAGPSVAERARLILEALLAGPETGGLAAPLPAGTTLASVFLAAEGVLYVDLQSADRSPPPAGGSRQELLTVYSIVDSLVLNLPEVRSVVLLWNGQQRESFSGHLDTSYPLLANIDLVAGTP